MYQIEIREDGNLKYIININPKEPATGFNLNQRLYNFNLHNIDSVNTNECFTGEFTASKRNLNLKQMLEIINKILQKVNGD